MTGTARVREAPVPSPRGTAAPIRARVAGYYDRTQVLYGLAWDRLGVHYGFREPGTRSRTESIRNLDRRVAAALELPAGARVLDAGCGVGGTSIFLAERGVRAVGITLSRVQARRARANAGRLAPPDGTPRFLRADYLAAPFADGSFDGLFAIESACYAQTQRAFVEESFRLLRPGGRLVVADGFRGEIRGARDARAYQRFLDGVALEDLASVEDLEAECRRAGFVAVQREDRQSSVQASALSIARRSWVGLAIVGLPCAIGLLPRGWIDHALAGIAQHRLWRRGVIRYHVVSATRPTQHPAPSD